MPNLNVSAVEARDRRTLRVTFDADVKQSDPTAADDALNPENYFFAIVNQPQLTAIFIPETVSVAAVDSDTVDLTVDDDFSYAKDYRLEVRNVESLGGDPLDPVGRFKEFTSADPRNPEREFELKNFVSAHSIREDESGDLRKFLSVWQDLSDVILVEKDRFQTILDPDTAPEDFLDAMLLDLGNPFSFPLDVNAKKKLVRILVPIYQQKGTKLGIRNVVRFFLGFDVVDIVTVLSECLILGESELGVDWVLCPSSSAARYSFSVIVDRVLTDEERDKLIAIIEYMKPAHTHLISIIEPTSPEFIDHWELGVSELGDTTVLHA